MRPQWSHIYPIVCNKSVQVALGRTSMTRFISVVSLAMLSACVSSNPWMRTDISDVRTLETQRSIDVGYCRRAAESAAPAQPAAVSAPASYQVSGTYYQPGHLPSTFHANVNPRVSVAEAGQAAYARGQARARSQMLYEDIFVNFMRARGWQRS